MDDTHEFKTGAAAILAAYAGTQAAEIFSTALNKTAPAPPPQTLKAVELVPYEPSFKIEQPKPLEAFMAYSIVLAAMSLYIWKRAIKPFSDDIVNRGFHYSNKEPWYVRQFWK